MSDGAAGLVAAGVLVAAGWCLTSFLPWLAGLPAAARLGWSYWAGLAWIGSMAVLLSWIRVPIVTPWGLATLVATPVVAVAMARAWSSRAVRKGRASGSSGARQHRRSWLRLGCAVCVVLTCAGVLARATSEPLADWDGRMTWIPAARWMCAERTIQPAVLLDPAASVSHPDYPALVPVTDCFASMLGGGPSSEVFRVPRALQLPALLAVIWSAAARWAGRRAAWLVTAAVALAPFPAWNL